MTSKTPERMALATAYAEALEARDRTRLGGAPREARYHAADALFAAEQALMTATLVREMAAPNGAQLFAAPSGKLLLWTPAKRAWLRAAREATAPKA